LPDGGAAAPWPVQPWPESVQPLLPDREAGRSALEGRFAGQSWQVEIVSGDSTNAFLVVAGKRQWLFQLDDSLDLRWAGDLDSDGKLDLLIQDGDEGPRFYLFLSSAARGDEIVHAVAFGFNSTC